jgi:hypothetical protein
MGLSSDETAVAAAPKSPRWYSKMAGRLAAEHAHVEATTKARTPYRRLLAADGFDLEVEADEAGVRMLGRGCPCRRFGALGGLQQACEHDRRMLEQLCACGDGAPTERAAEQDSPVATTSADSPTGPRWRTLDAPRCCTMEALMRASSRRVHRSALRAGGVP